MNQYLHRKEKAAFESQRNRNVHFLWVARWDCPNINAYNSYIISVNDDEYDGIKITLDMLYKDIDTDGEYNWWAYRVDHNDKKYMVWLTRSKQDKYSWPEKASTLSGDALEVMDLLMAWKPKD